MTESFFRGIRDVSSYANRSIPVARVTSRATAFSDPSFTYHVPRRILCRSYHPGRAVFSQTAQNDSFQQFDALSTRKSIAERETKADTETTRRVINGQTSNQTPISIYLSSIPQLKLAQTVTDSRKNVSIGQLAKKAFHTTSATQRDGQQHLNSKSTIKEEQRQDAVSTPPEVPKSEGGHFYDRIHMPNFHRPTKDELLAGVTGFWSRLRIRFKWLTIKSVRPFNVDEMVGFFSWIVLGHVVWIILGTTTFVSLAILAINTVFAQETLARWIGNYLTKSSGLHVVFESAIVPTWSSGVITFKNVFVSRRPGEHKSSVSKGSPEAAAIAAAAEDTIPPEDQNYTQFDITIGEINVTLSFAKWWNSKGLLQNVGIKHVRGVIDRTHVYWTGEELDPKSYRHEHVPGDFEIEAFKVEDFLVTVHQPHGFRPFPVSIYNAELPRLRKQWLFYDMLCANSMTGEFDHSLFTIHQRQTHSLTGATLDDPNEASNDPWRKQTRIRLDAMNIDHLNRGIEGPFSWIHEGNVDIVADIMIPNDTDESVIKVMTDFYDRMEATLTSRKHLEPRYTTQNSSSATSLSTPIPSEDDKRFMIMDLRIHLNDVRAVVPIFTRDLSYINNALIRPIVAYINSRRTFIPINCRVVKRATDFDGSWTTFDSGLMDDLSAEVYEAFARDVTDEQARMRRFKKVGLWSLQLAVQAIFLGMAGNMA